MTNTGPRAFFTADHRSCDALWAQLEEVINQGNTDRSQELWKKFDHAIRRHFDLEEEVLFPALEEATGMRNMGPTMVMRSEHMQMKGVLDQMAAEAEKGDYEALADHGDTLLILTQQHNVKEEGILYPMAEDHLGAQWEQLSQRLEKFFS
jgi:hemerythrin-like domain-containing protein